ncbi:MAG: triose-phosphate isomerase [Candidatus Marinimicrobia bacterium]|nr:triose-phosphate isomerase [Candidatus Neomarinimicrobiota bacterium]
MIFVNFKTYQSGTGEKALALAKICQKVAKKAKIAVIPVVQAVDLFRLTSQGFVVWVQHVDDIDFGPNTGQILPQAVVEAGAKGTLLNHSENQLPLEMIKEIIKKCQLLKLKTLICADNLEEAKTIVKARPDFLVYEPPEFIGSRTASVSTAKPEVIQDLVKEIKNVPVLVGAGIHSQKDVKIAIKLGAKGILVASDVVLAKNPEKELLDLAGGFR